MIDMKFVYRHNVLLRSRSYEGFNAKVSHHICFGQAHKVLYHAGRRPKETSTDDRPRGRLYSHSLIDRVGGDSDTELGSRDDESRGKGGRVLSFRIRIGGETLRIQHLRGGTGTDGSLPHTYFQLDWWIE